MALPRQGSSSNWGNQARYGEFEIVGAREKKPRLLGEGSFGKTFKGVRTDTVAGAQIQEFVAVKVLSPDLLSSEAKRYQFTQELVALTKFKHSNLIHYIRCGEENGEVYYAMELCQGGDLSQLVRRYGPLPERVVALIGAQVANGLKEVHQRHRLVHRDIKPSNVMLVDELEPGLTMQHLAFRIEQQESLCRIVDFGLVDFTRNAQDARQGFKGSPMYASPEQIREQPVDGRSDIYSLGMTLWYMVQGKGPLLDANGEDLRDMREAMARHTLEEEYESQFPAHLSPEFRALLAKMVAKRPERRFSSAAELHKAMADYLSKSESLQEETRFAPVRLSTPLETAYNVEKAMGSHGMCRHYAAREKNGGQEVRLTVVAGAEDNSPALEALVRKLCDMGELTRQPSFPPALLPVRDVIWATDMVAFTEDLPVHVDLSDVLRVRASVKRPLSFNEAYLILRPIAEALDFLLQRGQQTVYLPCEDVWVCGRQVAANPSDARTLSLPMGEWNDLQVYFSMMYLPPGSLGESLDNSPTQTLSGSMQMSENDLHPVPVFARLVYRILNGSEVAAAAQFTANAYVPAVTLGHVSNNLLRDVICNKSPRTTATAILKELCADGGVIWRGAPGRGTSGGSTLRPGTRATGSAGSVGSAGPAGSSLIGGSRGGPAGSSIVTPPAARSMGAGSSMQFPPQQSQFGAGRSMQGDAGSTFGPRDAVQSVARPMGVPSGSTAGSAQGMRPPSGDEKICEVVSAGVVRSPYDPERREQELAPEHWVPSGPVRCAVTGKIFRLPRKLSPLQAIGRAPGVIQSPFATPGSTQHIPWEEWLPGGEIVCTESGKRIALPIDLPLPEGLLPGEGAGVVISPYDRKTLIAVPPEQWEPGRTVMCPASLWSFVLPGNLPPLEALADPMQPGVLATPYNPAVVWSIPPTDWIAGNQVPCPVTRRSLTLPLLVEQWPAEATVANPAQRKVNNPFRPGEVIEVAALSWAPGAKIQCPVTGSTIVLPQDLPKLTGELVPNRPGSVRSPFTREVVSVSPTEWNPGAEVICPKTRMMFALPDALPEWAIEAVVEDASQRKIKNPFRPGSTVEVPLTSWCPGARVPCPVTGRTILLPSNLPLLTGEFSDFGVVSSPFTGEQVSIAPENWTPGAKVTCPNTNLQFLLPAGLPEWEETGTVADISRRMVNSPFRAGVTVIVPGAMWQPGAKVRCPATGRLVVLPPDLPLLQAEIISGRPGSVRSPYSGETVAVDPFDWNPDAEVLCPKTQLKFLLPHDLPEWVVEATVADVSKRTVNNPFRPGTIVEVPAASWSPGARIPCPVTGRTILLPAKLPLQEGEFKGDRCGTILSPFTGEPVPVAPENWIPGAKVTCPKTNSLFLLPSGIPEWVEEGTVADLAKRLVNSPFRSGITVSVPGAMWYPGAKVKCPATGRQIELPADLPPLPAEMISGRPGSVRSPYSGDTVSVEPADWTPGAKVTCPKSKLIFVLPADLPEWVEPGTVADLAKRLVASPFRAGVTVPVPGPMWYPGAKIKCPATGRLIVLPPDLPKLQADLIAGKCGSVRSPYSGEPVPVEPANWTSGAEVTCSKTKLAFVLPAELPEWVMEATVADVSKRSVKNPFRPGTTVEVPAASWFPGARIPCPATGRTIALPAKLPLLEAEFPGDVFGIVLSPYSGEPVKVAPESWTAGTKIKCPKTNLEFLLPAGLPEWAEPGTVSDLAKRMVNSPFSAGVTVQVPAAMWYPGATIRCPKTNRPIILPRDLPRLTGELVAGKLGVVRSPYSGETVSVAPIDWTAGGEIKCPKTKAPFLLPADLPEWVVETTLADTERRLVANPYEPGSTFEVPVASWEAGARISCPSTGRPILLPANLPLLKGELIEGRFGEVRSPFTGESMVVSPENWVADAKVTCSVSGRQFLMPAALPEWVQTGTVADVQRRLLVNPFSPGSTVEVPVQSWYPEARIPAPGTPCWIVLPANLPRLEGSLVPNRTGAVRSPYSGEIVPVRPENWVAGSVVQCPASKHEFVLPGELPEWEEPGTVANAAQRLINSPFQKGVTVEVPASSWHPGSRVRCPATGRLIALPAELPPLEGEVIAGSPGSARSPYSGEVVAVEPERWTPGSQVICPKTQFAFLLPRNLPEWTLEGTVANARLRLVTNPFRPGTSIAVPVESWRPATRIPCPTSGHFILLPADLPPLQGEVIEETPGSIISPFSQEVVPVTPSDWLPGAEIICPETGQKFVLPQEIPEWIPIVSEIPNPGTVKSPYEPFPLVRVSVKQWAPGQVVNCSATGRPFKLPETLPLLEGSVEPGRPGWVTSPYSAKPQEVPIEAWTPGHVVECRISKRQFALPADLEEWIVDGQWVPGLPGRVRSPYPPHPELDLSAEQWKPRALVSCPVTGRHFRVPLQNAFSSRELEKAAVAYALENPQCSDGEACTALKEKFVTATPAQIRMIWERHRLETADKRQRASTPGEIIPEEPGLVRSPFGSRPKVQVPLEIYGKAGAFMTCPETGRQFRLPPKMPALPARLISGKPGRAISPFNPGETFDVPKEQWQPGGIVRCPKSGQSLALPAKLPEWIFEASVVADQPGTVISPYGHNQKVDVCGADWYGGARISCPETGDQFLLPAKLPPMSAIVITSGRVTTPYEVGFEVRVTKDQWKPGAQIVCPATKRTFILPGELPPWNAKAAAPEGKPSSFPIAAIAAVIVVLLIVGGVAYTFLKPKPEVGGNGTPTPTPPVAQHTIVQQPTQASPANQGKQIAAAVIPTPTSVPATPAPTPKPTQKPVASAPRLVFKGGLKIADWTGQNAPGGLHVFWNKQPVQCKAQSKPGDPGCFILDATLPAEAREESKIEVEARLPGWKSLQLNVFPDENNDFVLGSQKKMERTLLALPLELQEHGTDYTYVRAEWMGAIDGESDAVPAANAVSKPGEKPSVLITITTNPEDRMLPSGNYRLTLLGELKEDDKRILKSPLGSVALSDKAVQAPIPVPESVASDVWGLLTTDIDTGHGKFYHLAVEKKASSVVLSELSLPSAPIFNVKDHPPGELYGPKPEQIWTIDPKDIVLKSPGVLEFNAPIFDVKGRWVYHSGPVSRFFSDNRMHDFSHTLEVYPVFPDGLWEIMRPVSIATATAPKPPATPPEAKSMMKKLLPAAIDIIKNQVPDKFKETDRYKLYLQNAEAYCKRVRTLCDMIGAFEVGYKTQGFAWIQLYPVGAKLFRTNQNGNVWDVDDKSH